MWKWVLLFVIIVLIMRVAFLVWTNLKSNKERNKQLTRMKTVIVIGSGGHTAEILRLVKILNPSLYSPRFYVIAKGDKTSETKVHDTEKKWACIPVEKSGYKLIRIPRSRNVGQSYFSSVFTTLFSFLHCIPFMLKERPDLILCNGPGTCIPICLIGFIMKVLYICNVNIVFVESVCRVTTLSLSGKILLYFADVVFVQWPGLQNIYKQTKYIGRLV